MPKPSLREVSLEANTGMCRKLNELTEDEWLELTHWMSNRFEQELGDRGMGIYYKADVTRMERQLESAEKRLRERA